MPTRPISPDQKADAERLRPLFHAWQEMHGVRQEEAAYRLGYGQSALSQRIGGRLAINRDFASKVATLIGVTVGEFSPRLAAEIEELSKSVKQTQPALVVTAAAAQPEKMRVRPALQRAMKSTIIDLAGPNYRVKEEYRLENRQLVDIAILDKGGNANILIECKRYDLSLEMFYKAAYLSGECWLMKHDAHGLPLEPNPKVFHIGLLENSDGGSATTQEETTLQSSYRQLMGGKLLDGFALLRVADMPNGETQLYDLPDTPETMARLLDSIKQATR